MNILQRKGFFVRRIPRNPITHTKQAKANHTHEPMRFTII